MIIEFDKSFEKSLIKVKEKALFNKIESLIETIEKAEKISEIKNVKKLTGFKNYYRIRIGDFRLGFEKINDNTIRFITVARRKDIYSIFP
ncbi:MAG: type II toxin-antitoxin system RelE/ParE family toxin [Bacteroidota bacterium]|jgi:mRNA interferase RelE/StbE